MSREPDTSPGARAAARRAALSGAARREEPVRGFARLVRPNERRRYVFQFWTTSTFAVAWLLVFVISGALLFLALTGGFALLAGLAAVALRVLHRRTSTGPDEQAV